MSNDNEATWGCVNDILAYNDDDEFIKKTKDRKDAPEHSDSNGTTTPT